MQIQKIPLNDIALIQGISNRTPGEIESSPAFFKLVSSIREIGGLIQPILVREMNNGYGYELIAGQRRYLAHRALSNLGESKYDEILSCIVDKDFTDEKARLSLIHENQFRDNPSTLESVLTRISFLPFLLGNASPTDTDANIKMGYEMLKLFKSYLSSKDSKKLYWSEKIQSLSKQDNPLQLLMDFFEKIGEGTASFYRKAQILFDYPESISSLFFEKKIDMNQAAKLHKLFGVDKQKAQSLTNEIRSGTLSYTAITKKIKNNLGEGFEIRLEQIGKKYQKEKNNLGKRKTKKIERLIDEIEQILKGES